MKRRDTPAEPADVNKFFESVNQNSKFKIKGRRDLLVTKVAFDSAFGFSNIKYDQEPCLLEYSSAVHSSLDSFSVDVKYFFEVIERAARDTGLQVLHTDFLELDADDKRLISDHQRWKDIRTFRTESAKKNGRKITLAESNYGCVIAATQVQISGKTLDWMESPQVIESLYRLEPYVIALTHRHTAPWKRWSLYERVFGGFPLLGFPDIVSWTPENWVDGLNRSPFFEDIFVDPKVQLPKKWIATSELYANWKQVRDFQAIRPKIYSALEFRSDPACRTAEEVIALTVLRLAVCKNFEKLKDIAPSYIQAKKEWWKIALNKTIPTDRSGFLAHLLTLVDAEGESDALKSFAA